MAQSSDPAEDTQLIVSERDGFTITVPASWQQEEPTDVFSVVVSDPDTQSRCMAGTRLDARPLDALAASLADYLRDFPDAKEVSEPRPVDIPAGEAFVVDASSSQSDIAAIADYYVQGDGLVGYIACDGPDRPEDDWLTIVETFEFLGMTEPAEDTQLIVSERVGFTITVPASWQQEEPHEGFYVPRSVEVYDPDTQSRCSATTFLDARPLDVIATAEADLIRDNPDFEEVSEPRPVDIPAGEAFVVDYSSSRFDKAAADYYVQGGGLGGLIHCAGPDRPEDDWLTIVETFEFLNDPDTQVALMATPIVAQDEVPATTVVPDEQFCMLMASNLLGAVVDVDDPDLAVCTQALTTLASAGMLPQAFAGLLTAVVPAEAEPTTAGKPVTIKGKGSKNTKPFTLAEGDYEVTLDKQGDCDVFHLYLRRAEDDRSVEFFEQSGYSYALDGGRHFIEVIAGDKCRWTVTITPLAG